MSNGEFLSTETLAMRLALCETCPSGKYGEDIPSLLSKKDLQGERFPGIGQLGEKSLHQLLKCCYEPDPAFREIPCGRYIADVRRENRIVEIQTAGFERLKEKLRFYLNQSPSLDVTVVYPITEIKYLTWVNPDSGEITKPRKSGKRGTVADALHGLYPIREFLSHPHLRLELLFFQMDEYRLLCGYSADKKKGSVRIERQPRSLTQRICLEKSADFATLLPAQFREGTAFTAADLQKVLRCSSRAAYSAIHLLEGLSVLCEDAPRGRAKTYGFSQSLFPV